VEVRVIRKNGSAPWLGLVALLIAIPGCGNAAPAGQAPAQPQAPASRGQVLATVNGVAITRAEVEDALGASLAKVEEQAYELRRDQLDEMIATRLLEAEAKTRGITVDQLVDQEVAGKVAAVSAADVDAFVKINRNRIQGDPAQLTPQITAYLRAQRENERRQEYVDGLRKAAKVDVQLAAPPVFRATVATDGFPSRGPADAPVTIVEFSDFHCPFCRSAQPTLNALAAKYPGKLRFVYRHFPLDSLHPQARRASEASWCAAEQRRFWEFHDRIYANGPDASEETIKRLAGEAGLDTAALTSCLASGRASEAVEKDVEEGTRHGVTGTPGFFVNGRSLSGNQPLETFVKVIDEELAGTR
jgi:protein-disulfide isomerase